jgi:predicted DNA-binding ribbon-helix-helix protein
MKMFGRKIRVTFDLREYWYNQLKTIAKEQGQTISALLRELIIDFIQKNQKEPAQPNQ